MGIKIDITPKDLTTLQAILKRYVPNTTVWAFGSRVKFTSKPTSDVDLVVFVDKEQEHSFSLLKEALEESSLPFRVDVHNWYDLPETFHKNIQSSYVEIQTNKKQTMSSEWKTYKLGDLGSLARGKSKHRPRDAAFLYGGKYPFIQTGDIKAANHRITKHSQTYSEEGLKQSKLWEKGTISITIAANIADTAILSYPACFPDSVIGFVADETKCDIDFMEYLLQYTKRNIQSHAIGSVQDNINLGTFQNIDIKVPALPTQRQIAQILSSLDDKIELNLQMNQTLEAMAQAIFKEWFVHFNFPGFDGELVDGLPKGWRIGSILEIANLLSGGTPKTDEPKYWDGEINWISAKDITSSNNQFIIDTEKKITQEGISKSAAKLLPKFTTIISARGTVGNFCILSQEMAISQSNYGLKSKLGFDCFIFQMVKNMIVMMKAFSYGTVFDTITTKTFQEMEIIIPENRTIQEFENLVQPLYSKILINQLHNQSLTQLRDTLLPKLMSGQLEVKK